MFHHLRHHHYKHMDKAYNSLKVQVSSTLTSQVCPRSTCHTMAGLTSRTHRASKLATCFGSSLEVRDSPHSISMDSAVLFKTLNELS